MAKGGARSGDRGKMSGQGGKMVGDAVDGGKHPVVDHAKVLSSGQASQGQSTPLKGMPPGKPPNPGARPNPFGKGGALAPPAGGKKAAPFGGKQAKPFGKKG